MFLTSLAGYIAETGMVQLNLMPSEKEGEIVVVVQGRVPKDGVSELYPSLTFEGNPDELDAELAVKIKEFMQQRAEIKTDLDTSLADMKKAADARKEAAKNSTKPKKPEVKNGTSTPEAKATAPAKPEQPSMSLFDVLENSAGGEVETQSESSPATDGSVENSTTETINGSDTATAETATEELA